MRVHVVINPAAGRREATLATLNDVFGEADIDWDVSITHDTGDAERAARTAAESGADVVAVYGGDGTVAEVAAALMDGGPPLLVLPGGTANALATDLGVPDELEAAAALVLGEKGTTRSIDLIRCGERIFALRMDIGFQAEAAKKATREKKNRMGWLAYLVAGVQSISDLTEVTYQIEIDDESVEVEGVTVMIVNSQGLGVAGLDVIEGISVSDGLLDVVAVRAADLGDVLGSAADVASGRLPRSLAHWSGTRASVTTEPPQSVLIDGDPAGDTPVHAEVIPSAIDVFVPRD